MKIGDLVRWRDPSGSASSVLGLVVEEKGPGWFWVEWCANNRIDRTKEPAMHLEVLSESR